MHHPLEWNHPGLRVLLCVCLFLLCCGINSETSAQTTNTSQKQILVHYMPWYASKSVSRSWGWHWTMNHFNPDEKVAGRRKIASHFYPQIGPYDSGDRLALEYHVQLMKLSGIDGVIIDWYGVHEFRDYSMVQRNTKSLIRVIKKAGLKYAICYEDQSVKHNVMANGLNPKEARTLSQRDFDWLDQNCFSDPAYVQLNGKPLLLVFGPQYLKQANWSSLKASCKNPPLLYGLPHLVKAANFDGAYGWPPVHGGNQVSEKDWNSYLDRLESSANANRPVAVAFPGFRDIYSEAKVSASYGSIDAKDGKTFEATFARSLKSKSKIIQIATWNDFGEGTNIEPTVEYGFRYLKIIQQTIPATDKRRVADLNLPLRLYQLRKRMRDPSVQSYLNKLSLQLLRGECEGIDVALKKFESNLPGSIE